MTVNTKTSKAVATTVTTAVKGSSATATTQGAIYNQVYSVGDKVYYQFNNKQLPCVVVKVMQHGTPAKDGTLVSYEVQGDISGNGTFPAGYPSGPFVNVSALSLVDR